MGPCPTTSAIKLILCHRHCLPGLATLATLFFVILGNVSGEGMKCSGYCTKDSLKCQLRGGKVIGTCSKNLMCCDPLVSVTGSCGDQKSGQRIVFFKSPNFPDYAGGDLLCDFKVRIRNDTLAIRVDFLSAEMDGVSFDSGGENRAGCEADMIFIRGFNTWSPPPRCGNLTNYGVLIDLDTKQTKNLGMLSIVALMSSPKYRFHVRIAQISKNPDTAWEVKESSIKKRSVTKPPAIALNPTKILIKTGKPAALGLQTERPSTANRGGNPFKIFNSQLPAAWKSPSIVNGEDTLISTVPWQVSIRVKFQPPLTSGSSSSRTTATESATLESMDSISEDEVTMESDSDSFPFSNCSESEGHHFCGGVIIDHRHVISASHCFFGSSKMDGMMNISSIFVVVGDTNRCTDDYEESGIFPDKDSRLNSYRYDVESIVFHYGYDHRLLLNDIAILRLNQSIKYFDHVKSIALARSGDNFEGKEALLSGWGDRFTEGNTNNYSTEEPMGPQILQSTKQLEIQNRSFCSQRELTQYGAPKYYVLSYPKYSYVFDSTVCTLTKNGSDTEVNTGSGDSGGPLVSYYSEAEPVLVGVVSYSLPVDDEILMIDGTNRTVDYYTSVAFYRTWIDLALKSFDQVLKLIK